MNQPLASSMKNNGIHARQIAFFCAFILPVYKLVEAPSLLAKYAKGDLLIPAFLHFLLQAGILLFLLWALSKSDKPLIQVLQEKLGKKMIFVYIAYGLYFAFTAILPLLDLEKFVYAVFYDTPPTLFSFAFFFILCAFVCTKGVKAVGRIADICLILFVLPFFLLILMSLTQADATNLLPLFEQPFKSSVSAFTTTLPHFSDVALALPLLLHLNYQKGDGKKIMVGYSFGAVCTLLFLGVFYALFSTIAQREHYAFSKIAQYFPALNTMGRIDLLLVYLLSIVLFFYTCIPLHYVTLCASAPFQTHRKTLFSAIVCFCAFLFTLFFNRHYNAVYRLITQPLSVFFVLFCDFIPLFLWLLIKEKKSKKKENAVCEART